MIHIQELTAFLLLLQYYGANVLRSRMNKYNVRCKLILPDTSTLINLTVKNSLNSRILHFMKEFISQMKRHAGIFNRNSQEIKNVHKNSLKAKNYDTAHLPMVFLL